MRTFLQILLLFLAFPLLIILLIITPLVNTAFDGETYKNIVSDSDIYTDATELIVEGVSEQVDTGLDKEFGEAYGADVIIDQELLDQTKVVLTGIIESITTEELVQDTVETNIDNIFDYLNQESDELFIYLPKEELLDNVKAEIPNIEFSVAGLILSYPSCNDEQINQFASATDSTDSIVIDCIPDEIKNQFLANFDLGTQINDIIVQLEEESELLQLEDQVELAEFLKAVDEESSPEQIDQDISELNDAVDGIEFLRTILIAVWVIFIILVILSIAVAEVPLPVSFRAPGLLIGITSALMLLPLLIAQSAINSNVLTSERISEEIDNEDVPVVFIDKLVEILRAVSDSVINPMIMFCLLMFVVGALMFGVSMINKRKELAGMPKK